jgi:hypothetical protein
MFRNLIVGLALSAAFALPLANTAEAAIGDGVAASHVASQLLPVEKAQFVYGGRQYCWYDNGWRGPGFYWCGYAYPRALAGAAAQAGTVGAVADTGVGAAATGPATAAVAAAVAVGAVDPAAATAAANPAAATAAAADPAAATAGAAAVDPAAATAVVVVDRAERR